MLCLPIVVARERSLDQCIFSMVIGIVVRRFSRISLLRARRLSFSFEIVNFLGWHMKNTNVFTYQLFRVTPPPLRKKDRGILRVNYHEQKRVFYKNTICFMYFLYYFPILQRYFTLNGDVSTCTSYNWTRDNNYRSCGVTFYLFVISYLLGLSIVVI